MLGEGADAVKILFPVVLIAAIALLS